jgi:hypothetical protein
MKQDPKARTSARPQTIDGVTFHCYRAGILRHKWVSEDGRLEVQSNYNADTYCASVDGTAIEGVDPRKAKRFRTQKGAMAAAILRSRTND